MVVSLHILGTHARRNCVALLCLSAICVAPFASAAVLDSQHESFDALSGAHGNLGVERSVPEVSFLATEWQRETPWQSETFSNGFALEEPRSGGAFSFETFAWEDGERISRPGGGWVEHGGLGGDDLGEGHECERGCVGTSAVPEPGRFALTLAGILAIMIFTKRKFRAGNHIATAH